MSKVDDNLYFVLQKATNDDLDPIVQYLLKASTESLSGSVDYKQHHPDHQRYVAEIEKEIRLFGGNSIVNIARGYGPPYLEVVQDVADHLKASYNKNAPIEMVEHSILLKVMETSWEKMSDDEKRELLKEIGAKEELLRNIPNAFPMALLQGAIQASGFLFYKIAVIIANAIAKLILGRGLSLAANAALTRTIGVFAGPIGWAITAIWAAIDIAGPAYRVTVPCVIHTAMLRQKNVLNSSGYSSCQNCSSPITLGVKFCPECGAKIQ